MGENNVLAGNESSKITGDVDGEIAPAGNATTMSASAGNGTSPSLESMAVNIGKDVENVIIKPIESAMGVEIDGNVTQPLSDGDTPENPTMEPTVTPPPPAVGANLDDPDADMMRKGGAKFRINSITNSLLKKRV